MKGNILKTTVITVIIVLLSAGGVSAQSGTDGSISWNLDGNGKLTVSASAPLHPFWLNKNPGWRPFIESIREIVINEGIGNIWSSAFSGCRNLKTVSLPNSLIRIEFGAFSGCDQLRSITFPSSVAEIGDYAFSGCKGLTSVTFPNSVASLGDYAFAGCTGLTSITLPNTVVAIGSSVFKNCTGLTSVRLSNSLKVIPDGAFANCTNIASVTVPDAVQKIGNGAFSDCTNLQTFTFGSSVVEVGNGAFSQCVSLISLEVQWLNPANISQAIFYEGFSQLVSIDHITLIVPVGRTEAYRSSTGIWSRFGRIVEKGESVALVTYRTGNLQWNLSGFTLTISGRGAMPNYEADQAPWYEHRQRIRHIVISEGVTTVGTRAFRYLTEAVSVSLPQTVTLINAGAFFHCDKLQSITLPPLLTAIGNNAFEHCESLNSITLPPVLTHIGDRAFVLCGVQTMTIPCSVTHIGQLAFGNLKELEVRWEKPFPFAGTMTAYLSVLIVPRGASQAYRANGFWSRYSEIRESNQPGCDANGTAAANSATALPAAGNPVSLSSLTVGLVAWYTFDGENADDMTRSGFNAALVNRPSFTAETVSGKGKALVLNGRRRQFMNIPYNPLNRQENYSVSFWIRGFGAGVLFSAVSSDKYVQYDIPRLWAERGDTKLELYTYTASGIRPSTATPFSYSYGDIQKSGWHMVTIVCKSAGRDCVKLLYIDGQLQDTANDSFGDYYGTRTKIQFGGNGDGKHRIFNSMTVDNIRIYNRSLEAREVMAIYNSEKE